MEHQLPENHACSGLDDWKAGKLKKFKKEVAAGKVGKESQLLKVLGENKWLEFLLVIGEVILAIIILRMLV